MYRPASVGSIARVMRPEKRGPRINPVVYVALGLRERLVKSRPPVNMPLLAASVGCFATLDDDDTAGAAGHRPRVSPHSSDCVRCAASCARSTTSTHSPGSSATTPWRGPSVSIRVTTHADSVVLMCLGVLAILPLMEPQEAPQGFSHDGDCPLLVAVITRSSSKLVQR